MISHNKQKKIAVINDLSGFGRCSLAVSMPVISKLKVQCCPVPTAILSNHTGFSNWFFDDYTEKIPEYIDNWEKIGLKFSAVYSGFLGSEKQIEMVLSFIRRFRTKETLIVVDPVMGDYGKTYSTYTPQMCSEMKKLVKCADILTPNITEACILTDVPYKEKWHKKEVRMIAQKLLTQGPDKVVITGIVQRSYIANYVCTKDGEDHFLRTLRVGTQRSGTGDIFASIIAADAVNGVNFTQSVKKASDFVKKCILRSMELDIPLTDGVAFEDVLDKLK